MTYRTTGLDNVTSHNLSRIKILNALYDLMDDADFAKISVVDICSRAGVSRKTFYRHFESKYDTVNQLWFDIMSDYMRRLGRSLTWHESLVQSMAAVEPFLPLFVHAGQRRGFETPQMVGARHRIDTLEETLERIAGPQVANDLRWEVFFFAQGEASLIERYVLAEAQPNALELAAAIESCIPVRLRAIVDGAVVGNPGVDVR